MRIAHVSATFPPYWGGTGNVAFHNAAELARRGHDVTVVTAGLVGDRSIDPPGVRVVRLPARANVGNARTLAGLADALHGAELIHLHYPFYGGGEQVWWHCRRTGTPYVATYHHDVLFSGPMAYVAEIHHRLAGDRILRGARKVAATTLDYVPSSRLATFPTDRLFELPNGVDAEEFRPGIGAGALRLRFGLDGNKVVLFVGGLDKPHYFKGLGVLLAALRSHPSAHLIVIGEGELKDGYELTAAEMGLADRVHFAGRVDGAELPAYYNLSDVVVLPSVTRGEAFGLVLVEGMAAGKPVIASRLPGVRSVVDEGRTGLLAQPGDAADLGAKLALVLDFPENAAAMGAAGRQRVLKLYAWERIGDRLEDLYRDALALGKSAAPIAA